MKRNLLIFSLVFLCTRVWASTVINWSSNGQTVYDASGTQLLFGDRLSTGYLNAGLVQLIYVGADGVYDGFTPSGNGTIDDDRVYATAWIGRGTTAATAPGRFLVWSPNTLPAGSGLIIRWFDTPSPSYGTGGTNALVPITGLYNYDNNGGSYYLITDTGVTNTFQMSGNWSTTRQVSVVPEPTTLALLGMGLAFFALRRRV